MLKFKYPRSRSLETARKWTLELGFNVVKKKGMYVDGHGHDCGIAQQKVSPNDGFSGFLSEITAPTEEAKEALLSDIYCQPQKVADRCLSFSRSSNQMKISPHSGLRKGRMQCNQIEGKWNHGVEFTELH